MYDELKQLIDENVNTNGRREVSGASLNEVLNAIVDVMGKGYRYGGQIDHYDEEPEDKEGMFYLSQDDGLYFNQFSLRNHDLYLFFFSNGNWVVHEFDFSPVSFVAITNPSHITHDEFVSLTRKRLRFLIANDSHAMDRMFSFSHQDGTDLVFEAPPFSYKGSVYVSSIALSSVEQNGSHNYKLNEFTI